MPNFYNLNESNPLKKSY